MASVNNNWLIISKDVRPVWWTAKTTVRVQPYGKSGAFVIAPSDKPRMGRQKGFGTLSPRLQLYNSEFSDGRYRVVPHDGDAIVIMPVDGTIKDAPDVDAEKSAPISVDPRNCGVDDLRVYLRCQAIDMIEERKFPQGARSMFDFVLEMAEKIGAVKREEEKKWLSEKSANPVEVMQDLMKSDTVSDSVRVSIAKELVRIEDGKVEEKEESPLSSKAQELIRKVLNK